MKDMSYEILSTKINDTSEAPRGKEIFYKCNICQTIIPSFPKDNVNCSCGNIGIDKDLDRLYVLNYSNFIILRKKNNKGPCPLSCRKSLDLRNTLLSCLKA